MDSALKADALIFGFGDILDIITPADLKRYNPGNDPFHSSAYFNDMIDDALKTLKPYVDNIAFLSRGNHEVEFQKRYHIDPLSILWRELNNMRDKSLEPIKLGAYLGFIKIRYRAGGSASTGSSQNWFFDHGKGGASEITKGTIGINRMMNRALADVYLTGHSHNKVVMPCEPVLGVNSADRIMQKNRTAIITGSYLENVKLQSGDKYQIDYGYEKCRTNQSTGGVMISHKVDGNFNIDMSIGMDC